MVKLVDDKIDDMKGIEEQRKLVGSEMGALKDEIQLEKDTQTPRYDHFAQTIHNAEELYQMLTSMMKKQSVIDLIEKSNAFALKMADTKYGFSKDIDYAININGHFNVDNSLQVLGMSKEIYNDSLNENLFFFWANVRKTCEQNVQSRLSLLRNSVPVDFELTDRMKRKEAYELFKEIIPKSFADLREDYPENRRTPALVKHLALQEYIIKTTDYILQIAMQYQANSDIKDLSLRGFDSVIVKMVEAYSEKNKKIKEIETKIAEKEGLEGLIDSRMKVKQEKENILNMSIENKQSELKQLEDRIMSLKPKAENPTSEEEEEDSQDGASGFE